MNEYAVVDSSSGVWIEKYLAETPEAALKAAMRHARDNAWRWLIDENMGSPLLTLWLYATNGDEVASGTVNLDLP